MKMTNVSGAVVWSASYDAFGKATMNAGSTVVNNLRFPGQYWDEETRLHYNWNRFYNPNMGKYESKDLLHFPWGDQNVYKYAKNNPLNIFDPLGLYDYRVHFTTTFNLAIQAGFDWWGAYIVAKYDTDVDYIYDPWDSYQNRKDWHFATLQRVYQVLGEAYSMCSKVRLGQALHVLQDYYGHTLQGYGPQRGHVLAGSVPDEPSSNWELYFRMRAHVKNVMKTFLNKCKCEQEQ
jgi:RHS repeat-associated protein